MKIVARMFGILLLIGSLILLPGILFLGFAASGQSRIFALFITILPFLTFYEGWRLVFGKYKTDSSTALAPTQEVKRPIAITVACVLLTIVFASTVGQFFSYPVNSGIQSLETTPPPPPPVTMADALIFIVAVFTLPSLIAYIKMRRWGIYVLVALFAILLVFMISVPLSDYNTSLLGPFEYLFLAIALGIGLVYRRQMK